ncbi:MAG TPA: hypothetical protein VFV67_11320 [Actinophytocola sp.]|uniref:hypothetical protein n=1 Tax=Actinophytocola sp. TaxID=1872138 RepID=UPI002DB722DC|nr:hypothetical protein [Actinophytocola sp.]HEU5471234.1 hypothetical protein [Actinophytocola sp.]
MLSGDFEVHLTGSEWEVAELAAFAARRGVKFSHIELDRGATPSQPMLTVPGAGTLAEVHDLVLHGSVVLRPGSAIRRARISTTPFCSPNTPPGHWTWPAT